MSAWQWIKCKLGLHTWIPPRMFFFALNSGDDWEYAECKHCSKQDHLRNFKGEKK